MRVESQILCETKTSRELNTDEVMRETPTDPIYMFSGLFTTYLQISRSGVLLELRQANASRVLDFISSGLPINNSTLRSPEPLGY